MLRANNHGIHTPPALVASIPHGGPNTEISCEDPAILALAGFLSFISLSAGF